MRKIGACLAIVTLTAVIAFPTPSEAFGLSLGPIRLGIPLSGVRHHYRHNYANRIGPSNAAHLGGVRN